MATLTDFDLHLIGQGTHRQAYERMGAHVFKQARSRGVQFAVWAPNAEAVSVVGDFNGWQPGKNRLEREGESGIWQGRIRGLKPGELYKYALRPRGSTRWILKADPYAFAAELRPGTASIVADLLSYQWRDAQWIERRQTTDWFASPVSAYEVHLGSWKRDPGDPDRFLTYRELAEQLPAYCMEMGYTHVELLPVSEHPLDMSWGYQTTGYFAPTARFGSPEDFMFLVDELHRAGIGVLLDWVPAHFPKDAFALAQFDSTHLYEHADPRRGEHPDWGTLIFNYGRSEVRTFLISNAHFWIDRYHIDGLRVDAVASMLYLDYSRGPGQWLPNRYGGRENLEAIDLLRELNASLQQQFPGILTIAEESTAWPKVTRPVEEGGLGFSLKWNMGWMHDTLRYLAHEPIYRHYHQNELTFSLMYAFSERFVLPLSHDEVVHMKGSLLNKMPGDVWQKFANLRLLFGYMWGHPGKKLLFMGGDIAQWREWNYAASLDWHLLEEDAPNGSLHRGVHGLIKELNRIYAEHRALHEVDFEYAGFEWIDFSDADNSVISFERRSREAEDTLIFVCNFTPVVRQGYRIGLPREAIYREILNTDDARFGGSGVTQTAPIQPEAEPWHGQPYSAAMTLPPLAAFILAPEPAAPPRKRRPSTRRSKSKA